MSCTALSGPGVFPSPLTASSATPHPRFSRHAPCSLPGTATQSRMEKRKFTELGLAPELLKAVDKMGFEEASPIQTAVIP